MLASGAEYAAHGALTKLVLGNGLIEKMTPNARLQPLKIELGSFTFGYSGSTCVAGQTWANNGNVVSQAIKVGTSTFTQSYGYDGLNRLTCAKEGAAWEKLMEDRVNAVLDGGAVGGEIGPFGAQRAELAGVVVGDPDGRQEAGAEELGENEGVDFVGLDARGGEDPGVSRRLVCLSSAWRNRRFRRAWRRSGRKSSATKARTAIVRFDERSVSF